MSAFLQSMATGSLGVIVWWAYTGGAETMDGFTRSMLTIDLVLLVLSMVARIVERFREAA